ncbi:MAG: ABC transporter permease [Oscillospiraceae bacterium]|nr:ABC transporter permease [Oscillospiraceae bacterium]
MIKNSIDGMMKYRFLLSQLVSRDFKTRYKRSILGVLWSMLNPLLTMSVQYIVFANIFKWDVDNYAVYLLIGTVTFNFFSEATQAALTSITGSASLITKVYIPTYVFPVAKVLSSCINLCFSTLALYLIIFIQGLQLNPYHLLIPVMYVMLIGFAIGIGLILSSLMVYFRDTQFLYGVVIVLWMYLTPLFYPVEIIPAEWMGIYSLNPMFQYVTFFRTLVLEGALPSLQCFGFCFGYCVSFLLIGYAVFRKLKRNFILYI